MILAEKIMKLRKQQGWSQEELAARLQVSRQSVSKWESMTSMPDLDKILRLSQIFGVSIDYLLNDDAVPENVVPAESNPEENSSIRTVSLEDANKYLSLIWSSSIKIAAGVAMCIFSPIPVIILGVLSEQPNSVITESMAAGFGVGSILVMIAVAVALFILESFRLNKYDFLEKEPIKTEYGVAGIAEHKRDDYEPRHRKAIVLGVTLCILAVLPLFLSLGFCGENDVLISCMIALLLGSVSVGVFLMVRSSMVWDSFNKLLEEGEFTRRQKQFNRKIAPVATIYWCVITAVYLGWSFVTFAWERTWIIWPVAGILYGAIIEICRCIQKQKNR